MNTAETTTHATRNSATLPAQATAQQQQQPNPIAQTDPECRSLPPADRALDRLLGLGRTAVRSAVLALHVARFRMFLRYGCRGYFLNLLAHAYGTRQAEAAQLDATNAAKTAIHHLLQRIQRDPAIAWHFDPITRSMEELTRAHAQLHGLDVEEFRKDYFATLDFQEPRCAGCRSAA